MAGDKEVLQKEDLFLLLESYKNSVEMNTVISQQLRNILEILRKCKDESSLLETNLKKDISQAITAIEKVSDKIESHNVESIKGIGTVDSAMGKLGTKIIILYFAIGSVVVSLIWMVYQLIDKFDLLKEIAIKVGV